MKIKSSMMQQKIRITGLLFITMLVMLPGFGNAQKAKKDAAADESAKETEVLKFNTPKEAFTSYTASNATVTVKKTALEYLQNETKSQTEADAQAAVTQLMALYTRETNTTALVQLCSQRLTVEKDVNTINSLVTQLITLYTRATNTTDLIQLCSQRLNVEKDTNTIYSLTTTLAGAYQTAQDYTNAVKVLNGFLEKQRTQTTPANVLATATSLSALYIAKIGQTNEALTMLDRELKQLPPDAEKERSGMVGLILRTFSQGKANDKIIEFCAKQMEAEKSPVVLYTLATGLSGGYQGLQDYTNSAKVLDTFLEKNRATSLPPNVLTTAKTLSGLYVDKFTRPDLAIAMWDRELKALPVEADPERAGMLIAKGDICFLTMKDMASAEAAYLEATKLDKTIPANAVMSEAYIKLAQVYAKKGNPDQAGAVLLMCLTNCPTLPASPLVQKMMEVDSPNPRLDAAVWMLRDRIAAQYANSASVDQYQPDIVKLLLKQSKNQEALQEARVFLHACSDKSLPAAIDLVTMAFKTIDGNLGRANNFLRYQKYGVVGEDGKSGTADDLKNPLLDAPPLNDERRNALFTAKLDTLPNNWTGWNNRATIYMYLDQPDEAFQALRKSFEMCPMNEKDLQTATDALSGFIIRNTKDVKLAESLVDYIMFGQMGKDGQGGTADDLKDPAQDIAHQIQYAAQRPAAAAKTETPKQASPVKAEAPKPAAQPAQPAAKPQAQPAAKAAPDTADSESK